MTGDDSEIKATLGRRRPARARRHPRVLRVVYSADRTAVGRVFDCDGASWTFGRGGDGVEAINDPRMSRKHAHVAATEAGYVVQDLGGTNGTFVNGARIDTSVPLTSGGVLSIGDTLLVLDEAPPADDLPIAARTDW